MSAAPRFQLVVTCEHAGNRTPREFVHLFAKARDVLTTHRGYDAGALELARRIAKQFESPLFLSQVTRLLVDLNRSVGHPSQFSEYSRQLNNPQRQQVLDRHYTPFREQVEGAIDSMAKEKRPALHLSVHSFTPVLNGQTRRADLGLLYDPRRSRERQFCDGWAAALGAALPDLTVRRNYPYRGAADGFTTYLRKQFPDREYAGIELEVNQKWVHKRSSDWRRLQMGIVASLAAALEG